MGEDLELLSTAKLTDSKLNSFFKIKEIIKKVYLNPKGQEIVKYSGKLYKKNSRSPSKVVKFFCENKEDFISKIKISLAKIPGPPSRERKSDVIKIYCEPNKKRMVKNTVEREDYDSISDYCYNKIFGEESNDTEQEVVLLTSLLNDLKEENTLLSSLLNEVLSYVVALKEDVEMILDGTIMDPHTPTSHSISVPKEALDIQRKKRVSPAKFLTPRKAQLGKVRDDLKDLLKSTRTKLRERGIEDVPDDQLLKESGYLKKMGDKDYEKIIKSTDELEQKSIEAEKREIYRRKRELVKSFLETPDKLTEYENDLLSGISEEEKKQLVYEIKELSKKQAQIL